MPNPEVLIHSWGPVQLLALDLRTHQRGRKISSCGMFKKAFVEFLPQVADDFHAPLHPLLANMRRFEPSVSKPNYTIPAGGRRHLKRAAPQWRIYGPANPPRRAVGGQRGLLSPLIASEWRCYTFNPMFSLSISQSYFLDAPRSRKPIWIALVPASCAVCKTYLTYRKLERMLPQINVDKLRVLVC